MNIQEGAGRMKRAGQWMVLVPSTIAILLWAVGLIAGLMHSGINILIAPAMIFAVLALYLAIAGGVLWLAGWIVEGFAKEPD
jgi:hypothetical protein